MSPSDALTVARLLAAVPVAALVGAGHTGVAAAIFVAAALTDAFDGPLARWRGDASERGAALDHLADKVLVVSTLGALTMTGAVPSWAFAAIAARETLVAGLRASRYVGPTTGAGRAKTAAQFIAVALALAIAGPFAEALLGVAVALTLATGLAYVLAPVARSARA